MKAVAIDHLVLNVHDLERSASWYKTVLGARREVFKPGGGRAPRTAMLFGDQKINLRPIATDKADWFTADHELAGSDDLCFLVDEAPEAVIAHLERLEIAIEAGPVKRQGARGTLRSVYCRDPDGNLIELASYAD